MTKALNRKNIYALFAFIFLQSPDRTFAKNILSLNLNKEECRVYEDDRDMACGVNLIQNYIKLNSLLSWDQVQTELAVDKISLVKDLTGKTTIKPPYEFIYTNRSPHEVRRDLVSYFEEAGIVINGDILNSPDYIGIELNFMAKLCADEVLALSQDHSLDTIFECVIIRLLQKEFLQYHISNWVPSFAQELINNATTDFFKGVGFLLKGFIHQECNSFGL